MQWKLIGLMVSLLNSQEAQGPDLHKERAQQLLKVRRVFVDKFAGQNADQIRELILNSLIEGKLFSLSENVERADAILKGSAEDLVFTDRFQYSEGTNERGVGSSRSSTRIDERRHEAMAAVRLVNKEGDVIWSSTQESRGAKFKSASADVAGKVMKKLAEDYKSAQKKTP
ncbi:MAG: hypothetical protein HYZ37_14020 [Candidatus Solibacter usitatus]|nr:hypothetical protein [Candidatus Solibacter usitatus]